MTKKTTTTKHLGQSSIMTFVRSPMSATILMNSRGSSDMYRQALIQAVFQRNEYLLVENLLWNGYNNLLNPTTHITRRQKQRITASFSPQGQLRNRSQH